MSKSKINIDHMQLGITERFSCSYLPERTEQLVFIQSSYVLSADVYEELMQRGFRRSGDDVYRPHCPHCAACQSTRILVNEFVPGRSQRRIQNKNQDLQLVISRTIKDSYFELYCRYIEARHQDGGMYPPQREQFDSFVKCNWMDCHYFELYQGDQLVLVSVNDLSPNALSAVYTFFAPELTNRSLGIYNILLQIDHARQHQLDYVYLGYQIDQCSNMKYKKNFHPQERYINDSWVRSE